MVEGLSLSNGDLRAIRRPPPLGISFIQVGHPKMGGCPAGFSPLFGLRNEPRCGREHHRETGWHNSHVTKQHWGIDFADYSHSKVRSNLASCSAPIAH